MNRIDQRKQIDVKTTYGKVITSFSYISFLFVVPLILQPADEFAKHHIRQGIVLFFFEIVVSLIAPIPLLGWVLGPLGWFASLVFAVYGVTGVFSEKETVLPYIGVYGEKIRL